MYDGNDRLPARIRFLPFVFGGLTGVSIALVIIAMVLMNRNSPGRAESLLQQAEGKMPTTITIDEDRRNAIVRATENVAPAVVSITASYTVRTRPMYNWFFDRYYPSRSQTRSELGSGFIIDKRGYVFTNYHVIMNAERLQVTLADGKTYAATLVGGAPSYDLALVKIDGDDFPAVRLGNSDDLLVGEWAIAIGSPFGFNLADTQPTVTVGVISANHRDIKQDETSEQIFNDMIQTDAAINPGNSGGPLVNSRGEVIGINTMIFSQTGGNVGLGFAIPMNRARRVMDEIVQYGRVRDVWLGMSATDITPETQAALNLPTVNGVLVQSIEEGGPADKAGLKVGDQIIAINGTTLATRYQANRVIFGSGVGDVLEMKVNRKDKLIDVKVTLEERPSDI
ncbi:MAG TPA: trypsin-like peptidase domain-containing protein [Candidatus Krumholzibacteria bacterium]|nr:trypsin-like peptidase domain-containing protein [Candidatus Krumholzibacteria bacterium]